MRLVVGLAAGNDLVDTQAGRHRERALVNDLVPRVELGNDEVAGGAVGVHPAAVRLMVGADAREAGEQAVVVVDDPTPRILLATSRRQHAHVARQHYLATRRPEPASQQSLGGIRLSRTKVLYWAATGC